MALRLSVKRTSVVKKGGAGKFVVTHSRSAAEIYPTYVIMKLNLFPLRLDFDEFQVYSEPYKPERLAELRSKHNNTHSFFRNGELIYISNKDGDENQSLGTLRTEKVFPTDKVASSLIKHIFFRTFKERFPGRIPTDFYPFRFFSEKPEDDFISPLLPEKLKGVILYKKQIELQLRLTHINNKPQFGFLLNVTRNWIFNKSCKELLAEGFDLTGLDVLHAEILPGLADVLAPNEEFIGELQKIEGDQALVKTSEGIQSYPLSELVLKKTTFNISSYLSFAVGSEKRDEILKHVKARTASSYNTKSVFEELVKIAQSLFTEKGGQGNRHPVLFQNKDGFCFTVDPIPLQVENSFVPSSPSFIFDHGATKTNSVADRGLSTFGPYDSLTFDTKSPTILCICHKDNRGYFTKFLADLLEGMPTSNWYKIGFRKKYALKDVNYIVQVISSYDVKEYQKIIHENESKLDAAIIEIPAEWKQIEDSRNPYYSIKAKLLGLEIPVQYITSQKVRAYSDIILNSIALQLYAKLGGIPWVLPSNRSIDREIIIGIGHSWLREKGYAGAKNTRIVGITTFLASDGQYLLSDKAKDVTYEEYFTELLRSLNSSIQRLEQEQAWNEGDVIRLIFHIFKPIKNVEFEVISQLVKQFPRYKIQFAFVTISKKHPFMLFDPNQPGITKSSGARKGEYIPNRASNVFIDSSTCVIQMLGAKELKTELHGMSSPLQIKIRLPQGKFDTRELDGMLFTDLQYIVQQIFSFTYLSWRSFLPGEQPATIFYSSLIAKLLSRLRTVAGWDPDRLNYKLKRKKWFL